MSVSLASIDTSDEDLPLSTLAERQPSQAKPIASEPPAEEVAVAKAPGNANTNAATAPSPTAELSHQRSEDDTAAAAAAASATAANMTASSKPQGGRSATAAAATTAGALLSEGSPEPSSAAPVTEPRTTRSRSRRTSTDPSPSISATSQKSLQHKSESRPTLARPPSGRRRSITPVHPPATVAPSTTPEEAAVVVPPTAGVKAAGVKAASAKPKGQHSPEATGAIKKPPAPRRSSRLSATSLGGSEAVQQRDAGSKNPAQPEAAVKAAAADTDHAEQPEGDDDAASGASGRPGPGPMNDVVHEIAPTSEPVPADAATEALAEAPVAAPASPAAAAHEAQDTAGPADGTAEPDTEPAVGPLLDMQPEAQDTGGPSVSVGDKLQQTERQARANAYLQQEEPPEAAPAAAADSEPVPAQDQLTSHDSNVEQFGDSKQEEIAPGTADTAASEVDSASVAASADAPVASAEDASPAVTAPSLEVANDHLARDQTGTATSIHAAAPSHSDAAAEADIAKASVPSSAHVASIPADQVVADARGQADTQSPPADTTSTITPTVSTPVADATAAVVDDHKTTKSQEAVKPSAVMSAVSASEAVDSAATAQQKPPVTSAGPPATSSMHSAAVPAAATATAEAAVAPAELAAPSLDTAAMPRPMSKPKLPQVSGSTRIGLPNHLSSLSKSLLGLGQHKAGSTRIRPVLNSKGLLSAPKPDQGLKTAQQSTSDGSAGEVLLP